MLQHKFISTLKEGEFIDNVYVVKEKQILTTKKGDVYLTLTLADKTGFIEARQWDVTRNITDSFSINDYIRITGIVGSYRKQLQMNIDKITYVESTNIEASNYIPTTEKDIEEMWNELNIAVQEIKNPFIQKLFESILSDRNIAPLFKTAPAATELHHAYLGGLLEHTVSMLRIGKTLTEFYPVLNRDILLAGIILHDIGKIEEFSYDRTIFYTDRGKLIGHIILGPIIVKNFIDRIEGFPKEIENLLIHMILSHHGELEWGAPKKPQCIEAVALHYIDNVDAKLASFESILKKDKDPASAWTEYSKMFEHQLYKGIQEVGLKNNNY